MSFPRTIFCGGSRAWEHTRKAQSLERWDDHRPRDHGRIGKRTVLEDKMLDRLALPSRQACDRVAESSRRLELGLPLGFELIRMVFVRE
jgi:hypothetical protein